jgi:flagellar basal body P-ring protein FlgI
MNKYCSILRIYMTAALANESVTSREMSKITVIRERIGTVVSRSDQRLTQNVFTKKSPFVAIITRSLVEV